MTGLALLHGWGFGPQAWSGWAEAFPERPVVLLDAGYFGPRMLDLPAHAEGWVGIGHSLGFAQLLGMDEPWRGLIGLGAFLRFCSGPGQTQGAAPETLDAMTARLDVDPQDVLTRFLRRCGLKGQRVVAPGPEGLQRLKDDLEVLRGLNVTTPRCTAPMLLLHAQDDRIAPLPLAQEAVERMASARLHVFPAGGHALPQTRTGDSLALCREFLHALD